MIALLFALSLFPTFSHRAAGVSLAWDPPSDKQIVNYRIYYADVNKRKAAKAKSIDVGHATRATLPNLLAGHTYYFVVTAINVKGRESTASNVVSCVAGPNPPAPPPATTAAPIDRKNRAR